MNLFLIFGDINLSSWLTVALFRGLQFVAAWLESKKTKRDISILNTYMHCPKLHLAVWLFLLCKAKAEGTLIFRILLALSSDRVKVKRVNLEPPLPTLFCLQLRRD